MVEGISLSMNDTYPYDDASHYNKGVVDPAEIEKIVDLHEAILRDYEEHGDHFYGDEIMYVRIGYIMDNGAEYYKRYNMVNLVQDEIDIPGTTTFKVDQFVNDPEVLEWAYSMEQARKSTVVMTDLRNVVYPTGRISDESCTQGAQEIWEAVQADFAAGNLGRRYLFDDEVRRSQTYMTDLKLRFMLPDRQYDEYSEEVYYERYVGTSVEPATIADEKYTWNWSMTITLTPKAERTLAALEKYYDLGGAYDIALHE
jgi:ABC-2 type transport system permease protein